MDPKQGNNTKMDKWASEKLLQIKVTKDWTGDLCYRRTHLENLSDSEPLSGINKELPQCNNSLSDFKWAWAGVSGKAIPLHMQGPELDHQQYTHTNTNGLVNISLNAYANCQNVSEKCAMLLITRDANQNHNEMSLTYTRFDIIRTKTGSRKYWQR